MFVQTTGHDNQKWDNPVLNGTSGHLTVVTTCAPATVGLSDPPVVTRTHLHTNRPQIENFGSPETRDIQI